MNTNKARAIYLRTADVVQCNMQKVTNQSGYLLEKAQVYFRLDTNIKVEPMMLALPITRNAEGNLWDMDTWNVYNYSAIRGY
jgi:hypothetical protein